MFSFDTSIFVELLDTKMEFNSSPSQSECGNVSLSEELLDNNEVSVTLLKLLHLDASDQGNTWAASGVRTEVRVPVGLSSCTEREFELCVEQSKALLAIYDNASPPSCKPGTIPYYSPLFIFLARYKMACFSLLTGIALKADTSRPFRYTGGGATCSCSFFKFAWQAVHADDREWPITSLNVTTNKKQMEYLVLSVQNRNHRKDCQRQEPDNLMKLCGKTGKGCLSTLFRALLYVLVDDGHMPICRIAMLTTKRINKKTMAMIANEFVVVLGLTHLIPWDVDEEDYLHFFKVSLFNHVKAVFLGHNRKEIPPQVIALIELYPDLKVFLVDLYFRSLHSKNAVLDKKRKGPPTHQPDGTLLSYATAFSPNNMKCRQPASVQPDGVFRGKIKHPLSTLEVPAKPPQLVALKLNRMSSAQLGDKKCQEPDSVLLRTTARDGPILTVLTKAVAQKPVRGLPVTVPVFELRSPEDLQKQFLSFFQNDVGLFLEDKECLEQARGFCCHTYGTRFIESEKLVWDRFHGLNRADANQGGGLRSIREKDLATLRPGEWLNDAIITGMVNLMVAKHNEMRSQDSSHSLVGFVDSIKFDCNNYYRNGKWTSKQRTLRRLVQSHNIFAFRKVLFAINSLGDHWVGVSSFIDETTHTYVLKFWDSLQGAGKQELQKVQAFYHAHEQHVLASGRSKNHEGGNEKCISWEKKFGNDGHCLVQPDGFNCGVFLILHFYFEINGYNPTEVAGRSRLSQEHLNQMRLWVCYCLLKGAFVDPLTTV